MDANGAYSASQAVRVAGALSGAGVTWFEEPVSAQDLAGLAAVRRQVRQDVAAGEYSWSLADSARLIEAGALDPADGVMRPDPDRIGHGLTLRDSDTERYRRR